ncbi:uncharacterized protein METZ01_LOCUS309720, partial [marine metagenome]
VLGRWKLRVQISCAYEQALPKANNPIPPAQFDLSAAIAKVLTQLLPQPIPMPVVPQ